MSTSKPISIRPYQPGNSDDQAFRLLNEEWITRYFRLESKDEASFASPQQKILDPGGKLLFAIRDNEPIGCCALLAMGPGEFEVAKMAVTAAAQGSGAGRLLLESAITLAREFRATRLYLETNHILTPAIRLYESVGFEHLPPERITPSPYARADVYMEMLLNP